MDERKQPSIYKKHPELQKSFSFDEQTTKEVDKRNPSFSSAELTESKLPEGIQTRQQMTQQVEKYMKERGHEKQLEPKSASADRLFRPTTVPVYFQKSRPSLYDQVRKNRVFYEEVADSLEKSADQYILFEEISEVKTNDYVSKKQLHKKNRSISLPGIIDEESRSLKQQNIKNFSLFPEE